MRLNALQRKKMPSSDFAGQGKSFPVEDAAHAANAKGRVEHEVRTGRMSRAEAARIKHRADKVLERKNKR